MSQENVEVVERVLEAFQRGGYDEIRDSIDEFIAPDFEMTQLAEHPDEAGGSHAGPDAVQASLEAWQESFDDFQVEFDPALDAGDHVVVVTRQSGRVPGTTAVVNGAYAILFTLDETKKIVRMRWFADRESALEAAGLPE
jgi:ketosteroid isomerase-like protein